MRFTAVVHNVIIVKIRTSYPERPLCRICDFNLDTACVELRLDDGMLLSIDCAAVENEVANSMYQRSELDWLIYNDPLAYAELILNGEPGLYLKVVTEKKQLD